MAARKVRRPRQLKVTPSNLYGGATGWPTSQTTVYPVSGTFGNGTTDAVAAINTAITNANAAGGGIVSIPAGTYVCSAAVLVQSNVKLQGAGAGNTIIKAGTGFLSSTGPGGGKPLISTNSGSNITLTGFTADHSGTTLNGNFTERLYSYMVEARASTNVVIDSIATINPFTYSIVPAGATSFLIINCNVRTSAPGSFTYDQLDGIHVLNSSFGDVVNNTVDTVLGGGDDALVAHVVFGAITHDVRYTGNTARGGQAGMQIPLGGDPADSIYNILVEHNYFWGSVAGGIHNGWYGSTGSIHDILIQNNIFDNNQNYAVSMLAGTGTMTNTSVLNNTARPGVGTSFTVDAGTGNVSSGNTTG